MLESVLFEPPVHALDDGDIRYPSFWFSYNGARKEGDRIFLRFTGWVWDMMHKEADNERDVWSDTTRIACDLIQYMDDADRDYRLSDSIEIQALSQEEPDLLSGVRFDWTVEQPMPSACLIPVRADGYLITEDGRPIYTQDGKAIKIDQATSTLVYAETGLPIITENGQYLILQ